VTALGRLAERARRLRYDDRGTALVEFFWLAVLLMVPLIYVVVTVVTVQRSAFAVTQAAQQAARAYATAGSDALGRQRAQLAAQLAMHDQGVDGPAGPVIDCGGCTYAPGSSYTATVVTHVRLPLVPAWLCGRICAAGITLSAHHTARLGCFIGTGGVAAGGPCP
jgi:Flp pilus assembly protein TadG